MGAVRWFGESWGAPICDPERHVHAPLGDAGKPPWNCGGCREPFKAGDQGIVMDYLGAPGDPIEEIAYHRRCLAIALGLEKKGG